MEMFGIAFAMVAFAIGLIVGVIITEHKIRGS